VAATLELQHEDFSDARNITKGNTLGYGSLSTAGHMTDATVLAHAQLTQSQLRSRIRRSSSGVNLY
jgi:hypothetical protein